MLGRAARVPRRRVGTDRAADGVAVDAEATRELADRDALRAVEATQLSPLLHGQHTLPSCPVVRSPGAGWVRSTPSSTSAQVGEISGAARG